jgi:hypothetical protein
VCVDNKDAKPDTIKPLTSTTGEQCTFDLLNLLALNSHQVEIAKRYSQKAREAEYEKVTIPRETMPVEVNRSDCWRKRPMGAHS